MLKVLPHPKITLLHTKLLRRLDDMIERIWKLVPLLQYFQCPQGMKCNEEMSGLALANIKQNLSFFHIGLGFRSGSSIAPSSSLIYKHLR